jgi:hypothetical protein
MLRNKSILEISTLVCLSSISICNLLIAFFFPLWLYSPILDFGRFHETFHFISVTTSRTVGRTPWTGDQLVARPLLTVPGDCDGEVGGMNGFGRGN